VADSTAGNEGSHDETRASLVPESKMCKKQKQHFTLIYPVIKAYIRDTGVN
jgi:hypothetical protein